MTKFWLSKGNEKPLFLLSSLRILVFSSVLLSVFLLVFSYLTSFPHRRTWVVVCCWHTERPGQPVITPEAFPVKQNIITLNIQVLQLFL